MAVPSSWEQLTESQLVYIMRALAEGVPPERVQMYAFLRFAGLGVVREEGDAVILRRGRKAFTVKKEDVCLAAMALDFICEPPGVPQRPERWDGAEAVDAALHGVPFGEYLRLENFFQSYLAKPDGATLEGMASILYPGLKPSVRQPRHFKFLIVHWLTGLKMLFARLFPDLFKPAAGEDGEPDMREIMLAEIRALTAGDVTKERAVLNVDTWTALAELNAKAREARELERMYKK